MAKKLKTKKPVKTSKTAKAAAQALFAPLDLLHAAVRQAELNAQAIEKLSRHVLELAAKINLLPDKAPAKLLTEPTNPASNLME